MKTRRLGTSTLEVSVVGLGGNNFGGRIDFAASERVVHKAIALGVNLIDTADSYGNRGGSEEELGRILGDKRKHIVLATKFGLPMDDAGTLRGASRRYIMHAVDASLKRLRTDWIDLYQLHRPDDRTPIEETLRALDELVRQGKVRYIGCSNLSAQQVIAAQDTASRLGLAAFVSCQDEYSLLERDIERELIPTAKAIGLGILPYFPLASGLLTGKYRRGAAPPPGSRLAKNQRHAQEFVSERNWRILGELEAFAPGAIAPCSNSPSAGCCAIPWSRASSPAPPRRSRSSRMSGQRTGRRRRRTWRNSTGSRLEGVTWAVQCCSTLRRPRYFPRFARLARIAGSSTVFGSKSGSSHSIMPSWWRCSGSRDRLQKRLVAGRAADIGGGTAALRADEMGIIGGGLRRGRALERHACAPSPRRKRSRSGTYCRAPTRRPASPSPPKAGRLRIVAIEQAPRRLADAELERMAVLPAERDLQHEMKIVETDRDRHFDAADHRRRHLVDLDAQTRDLGHWSLTTPRPRNRAPHAGRNPTCGAKSGNDSIHRLPV